MDNDLRIELQRLKKLIPDTVEATTVGELTGQAPNWTDANHLEALTALIAALGEQPTGGEIKISDHLTMVPLVNHIVFVLGGKCYASPLARGG